MSIAQPKWLYGFLKESLEIESIFREPTPEELVATWEFIQLEEVKVTDLCYLVHVYQSDAVLRDNPTKNVWIGGRQAPVGGLNLVSKVGQLVWDYTSGNNRHLDLDPWLAHSEYEYLHPFTDGNGRSGRAFWANLMYHYGYKFQYKFLQMFYYQTLSHFSRDY